MQRSARDEMRHVIGSSESNVVIGSDRDRNRGCRKKGKDHMEFLCAQYEAHVERGRHFVHELSSQVNSRIQCVAKIMAMPGTKTTVADLCMFGLAACAGEAPGFVKTRVYGRSPTRDKLDCGCEVTAQAHIDTLVSTRATQPRT